MKSEYIILYLIGFNIVVTSVVVRLTSSSTSIIIIVIVISVFRVVINVLRGIWPGELSSSLWKKG